MELAGRGVKERMVGERDSLNAVIELFTDSKSQKFDGWNNSLNLKLKQRSIEETLQHLTTTIPFSFHAEENKKLKGKLGTEYICSAFGLRYDELSPDLFDLQRVEEITIGERKYKVQMPLFAHVSLGSSNGVWTLEHLTEVEGAVGKKFQHKVDISAEAPNIPDWAQKEIRQARGYYYKILSQTLEKPIIGDLFSKWLEEGSRSFMGEKTYFEMSMYWIPKPEELKIKKEKIDLDPIIAAQLHGHYFCVAHWDSPVELPYERYLREFTEKKAYQEGEYDRELQSMIDLDKNDGKRRKF